MKTLRILTLGILLLLAVGWALPPGQARAQDETPEFRLNVKRDFGFSSGSQIRGRFTNAIVGDSQSIQSVTYLIDGKEMATVAEAPFSYSYQTGDFALGWHDLSARVTTQDGRIIDTPTRRFQFVSSEEEMAFMQRILLPLFGSIFALMALVIGVQMVLLRDKTRHLPLGAPRHYGLRGGTICKRCGRPFAIHLWAANLGPWKFDRCDFCGKWAVVMRASQESLRLAEQAEAASAAPQTPPLADNPDDKLRKQVDDTRYIDDRTL